MLAEDAVGLRVGPVAEARASALLFLHAVPDGYAWLSGAVYNRMAIVIMRRA